ncbi:TolB amino-terminal domain-containing protein [Alteromonadaceae bacterium Bs31]|nr:TolB amino-terminal domain-containing protein [Alteromonadaceae bacterium Bs31]
MIYTFNSIEVNTSNFTLLVKGSPSPVEPQVFDLIVYLIKHRDRLNTRQQIFDDLWTDRVVSDATLSNHIKAARALLGDDGERQAIIKTVRGRGYQFIASVKESGTALTQPETSVAPNKPREALTRSKSLNPSAKYALGSALIVVFLLLAYGLSHQTREPVQSGPAQTQSQHFLAVLPFTNRSQMTDDQFFTDGVHDDLLTQISKISTIKTISSASVLSYRNTQLNTQAIAKELNVNKVLLGGVQRAGNKIRINAQLIDAKTEEYLWAETYTRTLSVENVFTIQTEIAQKVAEELRVVLSPQANAVTERLPTHSMAALEEWFKAKASQHLATPEGHTQAIEHLKKAIAIDPEFSKAYAEVALAYLAEIWEYSESREKQTRKAEAYVLKALALDSSSSRAHTALGRLMRYQGHFSAAEMAFKKAIALNPNDIGALSSYAEMLNWDLRNGPRAIELYQRAIELNPSDLGTAKQLGETMMSEGRNDEALAVLENLVASHPEFADAHSSLGTLYSWGFSKDDLAIKSHRRAAEVNPRSPTIAWRLADSHQLLGDKEGLIFWAQRTLDLSKDKNAHPYYGAQLARARGNMANAFEHYKKVRFSKASNASMSFYALAQRDIKNGDLLKALKRYSDTVPELDNNDIPIDATLFSYATGYAECLLAAGQNEKAKKLLARAAVFIPQGGTAVDWYMENLALYWVIAGNNKKAIEALQTYAEQGKYINFVGKDIAYEKVITVYEALKYDADFQAVFKMFEQRKKAQLRNLKNWESLGELAEIPALPDT